MTGSQIPFRGLDNLVLFTRADGFGRGTEGLTAARLDFDKYQVAALPGDNVDLTERGRIVAFKNPETLLAQKSMDADPRNFPRAC